MDIRCHDRGSFFKYMSADTARIVLQHRTLRWSSPLLFNDPFDVPRELAFGLAPEDIVRAIERRLADLIEHPPDDTSGLSPQVQSLIEIAKRGLSSGRCAKILSELRSPAETLLPKGEPMDALRQRWREQLSGLRILCLTESPGHMAMWHHYADKYRGVVIELRCDDEVDSAWLVAQPVDYPDDKPLIYTAEGWAELLMTEHERATERLLHAATFTKSPDWRYESEWRIAAPKRPPETGLLSDYPFHAKELSAVYLGPHISPHDRADIHWRVRYGYPDARLIDVSIGMDREFIFTPASDCA